MEELEAQERQEASSEATAKAWGDLNRSGSLKGFMLQLDFIDYIATESDALVIFMNLSRCICIYTCIVLHEYYA